MKTDRGGEIQESIVRRIHSYCAIGPFVQHTRMRVVGSVWLKRSSCGSVMRTAAGSLCLLLRYRVKDACLRRPARAGSDSISHGGLSFCPSFVRSLPLYMHVLHDVLHSS